MSLANEVMSWVANLFESQPSDKTLNEMGAIMYGRRTFSLEPGRQVKVHRTKTTLKFTSQEESFSISLSDPFNLRFWSRWNAEKRRNAGGTARNSGSKAIIDYVKSVNDKKQLSNLLTVVKKGEPVVINEKSYDTNTKENLLLAQEIRDQLNNIA